MLEIVSFGITSRLPLLILAEVDEIDIFGEVKTTSLLLRVEFSISMVTHFVGSETRSPPTAQSGAVRSPTHTPVGSLLTLFSPLSQEILDAKWANSGRNNQNNFLIA